MTTYRKVKRVLDGDTFQTYRKVNGSNYVRLAGVNAPERWQFGGKQATEIFSYIIYKKLSYWYLSHFPV